MRVIRACFYWGGLWLIMTLAICLVGAIAGALLFPVGGRLLRMDLTMVELVRNGIFDGGFLALIWAPGASFIICVMLARRRLEAKSATGNTA